MKPSIHRNSHENDAPHHLYEFYDRQEDEIFKYGISSDPIDSDGLSRRIRRQLDIFNLAAGFFRYIARILVSGIPGRKAAEALEDRYISDFEATHGRLPRGNKRKNKKDV